MVLILNVLLIFIVGVYVQKQLRTFFNKIDLVFYKYYFGFFVGIHFLVSLTFAFFLKDLSMINDPQDFFNGANNSESWLGLFGFGHSFISFLIYPFVKVGVSIEVLFLLFSTISFKGFLIYFELLEVNSFKSKQKVFLLLFFLIPSIHFWTGFLGKDPLLFFLMALVLKKVYKNNLDVYVSIILIFIFLIRPHVGIVLVGSFLIYFLIDRNKGFIFKRNLIFSSILILSCLLILFLFYFLKIEDLSINTFSRYYNDFISYATDKGNTSISLQETNLFTRIFYLLLMPLPFLYPINSIFLLIVSIEDIYYLIVFVYMSMFFLKNKRAFYNMTNINRFAIIASISLIILFGSYLYNIGLGNRMRVMFYPYLFYFLISSMNTSSKTKK